MASGVLLEIQPEDIEPVEFTHFDEWQNDPVNAFHPDLVPDYAEELKSIIGVWEKTLKTSLDGFVHDLFGGCYEQAMLTLGIETMFDLFIMNVLQ